MTKDETKQILKIISATFPNFKPGDIATTLEVWSALFVDHDFMQIQAALKSYILTNTSGFAPSPGQIIEQIPSSALGQLGDMESWALVRKAISRSGYNSVEEFAKLPLVVRQAVGNPENLKEWALMEQETVDSVIHSNFLRSYRAAKEHERRVNVLPREVRKVLGITTLLEKFGETTPLMIEEEEEEVPHTGATMIPEAALKKLEAFWREKGHVSISDS